MKADTEKPDKDEQKPAKPRARVLRRFVVRGNKLVEVRPVMRETR